MKSGQEIASRVKKFHLISKKLVENLFAGNYHSVFKGPGLEFDEVREYIFGDDPRFIDWNVSSRMGMPYSKTFREERELVLQMVVDISSSLLMGSGENTKLDTAGMVFSLLAFAAVANNDRVGTVLFSDVIEHQVSPMKGKKHVMKQISMLLSHQSSSSGSNLGLALRSTSEFLKRRGIVVILSDFRADNYGSELSLLARQHDVIAIRITDPLDKEFPDTGLIELEDPESGEIIPVWGKSLKLRKKYRDNNELDRLNWLKTCRSCGVDTLEVGTDQDPGECLLRFFYRRKKR